jgi:ATP-binding cassette subfamily B protein
LEYRVTASPGVTPGRALLKDLPIFALWPEDERERVADRFVRARYPFGANVVKEGEAADALFVIVSGTARVVKRHANGEEVALDVLRAGDNFGEQGLLDRGTRAATVRASGDLEVLRLDKGAFDDLLGERPELRHFLELQIRHRSLLAFLRLHSPFGRLPAEDMRALLEAIEPLQVATGARVIHEGDPPGPLYIVRDGRLRTFQKLDGRREYRAFLRPGDAFGARSMLERTPRWASVEAVDPCSLLVLPQESYARLLATRPAFRTECEALVTRSVATGMARLPLDFAQENLPAETSVFAAVSLDQIDQLDRHTAEVADENGTSPAKRGVESEPPLPFASDDGRFIKRGTRIRTFPHVQQIDEMDCGAACIAMIVRHYGRRVPLARIRALSHTSLDGTSLRGLCRAASELGLAARAVKTSARHLMQMPLPAIVHWDGRHWVVLYDVSETHVRIADPALGLRRLTRREFEARWNGYAALFDYTGALADVPEQAAGMAWLLPFVRPYKRVLAQAVALALVVSALQMTFPVFMQIIVDGVLVERDVGLLNTLGVVMLGLLVFMTTAIVVQRYLLSFVAVRVDSLTLDALTRTLLTLPMTFFTTRRTGDIQRRLAGLREIRQFCVEHGVALVASMAQLAAALALMGIYSVRLTAVFLVTVPIYVLMMRFASRSLRPLYNALEDEYGKYQSYQIDAIKGIETVKALGAETTFRELMLNNFHALARRRFRADFMMLTYDGGIQMVTLLTLILFLWMGARLVMRGELTIGALVAFNTLVAMASSPIASILSTWDNLQVAKVRLRRLDDVLQQEPEQGADHSRLVPVRTLEGRISFKHVGFRYGGPESPRILDDITFDVIPNTRVAIVGRSGSGKTTLIKCFAGMLEPTEGTIFYDGLDLRTLNYRDLRRQIGFVLQENFLFSDTIAHNIAFGEEEPDMDAVVWAAKTASADEFIERLPLGYDTKVGESGLALSAGQRQRIAIARALYHRPPILVFDEATSALDSETERAVTRNIDRVLEGRTSFVIAHRLSTVRDADRIIVLEHGRLAEHGTHPELMQREGLYYHLVSQQLGL